MSIIAQILQLLDWKRIRNRPGYDRITTVTADPALTTDGTILCNAAGGAFNVTLPAAASHPGRVRRIKKVDASANEVTITRSGSDTIDGATTLVLVVQYASVDVQSDGSSGWWVL